MKRLNRRMWIIGLLAGGSLIAQATPERINYQGRLVNGSNLVSGTVSMEVALYPTLTGGLPVYAETQSVQVVDGLYTFAIGASASAGALRSALNDSTVFLELTVNGNTMSPREQLGAVAYALNPDGHSLDAADGSPQDVVYVNNSGFVGVNRQDPITASESFGVHRDTSSYGGMYISTAAGGQPFYGYATDGSVNAWHYVDPDTGAAGEWHLFAAGYGIRMTMDLDSGHLGLGTADPSERLDVEGSVRIRGGSPAAGKVLTAVDATGAAVWSSGELLDELSSLLKRFGSNKALPLHAAQEVTCASNPFSFSVGGGSLGDVVGFVGCESISAPYRFRVLLEGVSGSINPYSQIGLSAELLFVRNSKTTRFVGEVTGFSLAGAQSGNRLAVVEFGPSLHALAHRKDYRILQERTVPQVIGDVYSLAGTASGSYNDSRILGSYNTRSMIVQHGETDLDFINRLMEKWGIFYYFEHGAGGDVMTLADSNSGFTTVPGSPFSYLGHQMAPPLATTETIRSIQRHTDRSSMDFLVRDRDVINESTVSASGSLAVGDGQQIDFGSAPSDNSEAGVLADVQKNRAFSAARGVGGSSTVGDFSPGYQFTMTDSTGSGLGATYNLTSVTHIGMRTSDGSCYAYGNEFTALPDSVPYRPTRKTPVPHVAGLESATVTGPGGEEIHVDEHGRVKVQFHWDTYGNSDENSSGWVPILQNEHSFFLPRVGSEVAVAFLNGDPDRPVVMGRIMNDNQVPYSLPDDKTRSGFKTATSPGGSGANEIRFEDKSGSEEMFLSTSGDLVQNAGGAVTVTSGSDMNFDNGTLVVDVDGDRVGIGDTTPDSTLEMRSAGSQTALMISNDETDGDPLIRFRFGSATQFAVGVDDSDDHFKISDNTVLQNNTRLTIHGSTGNVGVKRTPTTHDFEVQGSAAKTDGSTLWLVVSDRNMKEEIAPITGSLDRIDALAPVSYRYNDDYRSTYGEIDDKARYGFIAQEFGEVFPDDIHKDPGTGYFSMDAGAVIPHLVAAVKELKAQNERLRKDMEKLKAQKQGEGR